MLYSKPIDFAAPLSGLFGCVPMYCYGLPAVWIDEWQVKYYSGIAVDIHGKPIGARYPNYDFKGVAIDPDDPPTFESQAAYLKRRGLFLAGEERRLKKVDFEAELFIHSLNPSLRVAPANNEAHLSYGLDR
jgi:hypothetical protein